MLLARPSRRAVLACSITCSTTALAWAPVSVPFIFIEPSALSHAGCSGPLAWVAFETAAKTITDSGGEVVYQQSYDPAATSFDSEIDAIAAADPDAIIVIGFNESSKILRAMVEKGIGPKDKAVYGSDGNIGNALGVDFDAGN